MSTNPITHDDVMTQVGPPAAKGFKRYARVGLIAFVAIGGIGGLIAWRASSGQPAPVHYVTTPVTRGDLASTVTATGTLEGKDTVSIGAETSGRVRAVLVDFNDSVKAGQVLAEIDPSTIRAQLQQATAQLAAARAGLKNAEATAKEAKLTIERTRAMAADGLVPQQQLETAEAAAERAYAAVDSAKAQIIVSQASVDSNTTSLERTQIRSPIDGVVLSRSVEVGQALAVTMTTPELFVVARNLREMEVTIAIDEADVGRTQVGQRATFTVDAWPGRHFDGVLRSIHNVAVKTDNVVTYEALLSVDNADLVLRPGMTATVTIATDERKAVLQVPNAALRFAPPVQKGRPSSPGLPGFGPPPRSPSAPVDAEPHVWVLRNEQPVRVAVTKGMSDGVRTEVSGKGLEENAQVITDAEQGGAR